MALSDANLLSIYIYYKACPLLELAKICMTLTFPFFNQQAPSVSNICTHGTTLRQWSSYFAFAD